MEYIDPNLPNQSQQGHYRPTINVLGVSLQPNLSRSACVPHVVLLIYIYKELSVKLRRIIFFVSLLFLDDKKTSKHTYYFNFKHNLNLEITHSI